MGDLINLGIFLTLVTLGFVFGRRIEAAHYAEIRRREAALVSLPVRAEAEMEDGSSPLPADPSLETQIVSGNVVVANDYFKTFVASLKTIVGGRLTSYESLMDRARREAVLRMKEQAKAWGATEVLGMRLESTFVEALGLEVMAYGTAVRPRTSDSAVRPLPSGT
jgi:uncharacterized protein YbjQ (UPF0145 family)